QEGDRTSVLWRSGHLLASAIPASGRGTARRGAARGGGAGRATGRRPTWRLLLSGDGEVLSDLGGHPLTSGGHEVSFVNSVRVSFDPEDGRAGVLRESGVANLGRSVTREQMLIRTLRLRLIHRSRWGLSGW